MKRVHSRESASSEKKKKKISVKLKSSSDGKSSKSIAKAKGTTKGKATTDADQFSLEAVLENGGNMAEYDRLKDIDTAEDDNEAMRFDDNIDGKFENNNVELLSFIKGLGLPAAAGASSEGGGAVALTKKEKKLPKKNRKAAAIATAGVAQATDWKADREARILAKKEKGKGKGKGKASAGSDDDAMEQDVDDDLENTDDDDDEMEGEEPRQQHGIEVKSSETPLSALPQDKQTLVKELKKRMLIEPVGIWHGEKGAGSKTEEKISVAVIARAQERAATLLVQETGYSEQLHTILRGGEETWMKTILKDGTLGDRLAAWMLRIQESPLHRLKALDTLLGMLTKRSKREALLAMDTLSELWQLTLLPERKLVLFSARPVDVKVKKKEMDRLLVLWQYEAELKARYQAFVQALDGLTHNNTEQVKNKALGVVYELLKSKPEQEQALLATLCNKLGDPEKKVAAKARHLLAQLVEAHPAMKTVVAKEVQHVLSRPNMEKKAQYQTICFLNQLELSRTASNKLLARRLIEIYFQFFDIYVKKAELEAKMLSALLTGVNRAFPFADMEEGTFTTHIDTLFKVVHAGAFGCSIQALSLLLQVMDGKQAVSDRFFRAVYEKLLDPDLLTSSKQAMFLNLVYRSMKADPVVNRVKSFVKRLLQVCAVMPANFVCGALLVVSEAADAKPSLKALMQQAEELDEEENFEDVKDSDDEEEVDEEDDDEEEDSSNDDDENFQDAPDSDESDAEEDGEASRRKKDVAKIKAELAAAQAKTEEKKKSTSVAPSIPKVAGKATQAGYDMKKREPLYSGAETTCLWEIVCLAKHYHPSVETFCKTLRNGGSVKYAGDPLRDFTSSRFLERFVFKKPKKKKSDRGGSIMQPKHAAEDDIAMVNSEDFLKMKREDVPVEERFFHTYFKQKKARSGVQEVDQSAEMDAAAKATAVTEDATDDLDFAAAFGISADGDEFDDDEVDAPEGGEYDYDKIVDESDDEMEGELDLEAIARDGFDEEIAEQEDDDGTGGGTFAAAEDFEDLLAGGEDAGTDKERARDLSKGMDSVRSAGQSNRKFRRKRGPGKKR